MTITATAPFNGTATSVPTTDLPALIREVSDYLNGYLIDRSEAIEAAVYGMLTGQNVMMWGPPGTSKSYLARLLASCLHAEFFAVQFHQLMGLEDINGPLNMKKFDETGEWVRKIEGYYPTAEIALTDEVDKASAAVLGPMLTAWNERTYRHGDTEIDLPTLFNIGTSNAALDDPTAATFDRWLIRTMVDYVKDGDDFLRLLQVADAPTPPASLTVDDVRAIQAQVATVSLSGATLGATLRIRMDLREAGIVPSDRRWLQSMALVRATAWLDGRTTTVIDDLAALRFSLWLTPEQQDKVTDVVLTVSSPQAKEIRQLAAVVDAVQARFAAAANSSGENNVRWAVEAKTDMLDAFAQLREMREDGVGGRSKTLVDDLMTKIPEITARLMMLARQTRTIEAARAALKFEFGE